MNRIFVEDIARELHEAAERARTIVLVSPYVKKSALAALLDPAAPFSRLTLVARALARARRERERACDARARKERPSGQGKAPLRHETSFQPCELFSRV